MTDPSHRCGIHGTWQYMPAVIVLGGWGREVRSLTFHVGLHGMSLSQNTNSDNINNSKAPKQTNEKPHLNNGIVLKFRRVIFYFIPLQKVPETSHYQNILYGMVHFRLSIFLLTVHGFIRSLISTPVNKYWFGKLIVTSIDMTEWHSVVTMEYTKHFLNINLFNEDGLFYSYTL